MYVEDQPHFYNCVVDLDTKLQPHELIECLKKIEMNLGRDMKATRYGPRVIDLDILTFAAQHLTTMNLTT